MLKIDNALFWQPEIVKWVNLKPATNLHTRVWNCVTLPFVPLNLIAMSTTSLLLTNTQLTAEPVPYITTLFI
jgi:hypothetical protein